MSVALYGEALVSPHTEVMVRAEDGELQRLPSARWVAAIDPVDERVTQRLDGPTLDIGCGPGRLVSAIAARGIPVLGIDIAPTAVHLTRQRGGAALHLDVFGSVPGTGRWSWALLLDGNIGIGGNPQRLLSRTAQLVKPGGHVVVEVEAPGSTCRTQRIRLEAGGRAGTWFPWSWLSADCVGSVALECGLRLTDLWRDEDRCFAELVRP